MAGELARLLVKETEVAAPPSLAVLFITGQGVGAVGGLAAGAVTKRVVVVTRIEPEACAIATACEKP